MSYQPLVSVRLIRTRLAKKYVGGRDRNKAAIIATQFKLSHRIDVLEYAGYLPIGKPDMDRLRHAMCMVEPMSPDIEKTVTPVPFFQPIVHAGCDQRKHVAGGNGKTFGGQIGSVMKGVVGVADTINADPDNDRPPLAAFCLDGLLAQKLF